MCRKKVATLVGNKSDQIRIKITFEKDKCN